MNCTTCVHLIENQPATAGTGPSRADPPQRTLRRPCTTDGRSFRRLPTLRTGRHAFPDRHAYIYSRTQRRQSSGRFSGAPPRSASPGYLLHEAPKDRPDAVRQPRPATAASGGRNAGTRPAACSVFLQKLSVLQSDAFAKLRFLQTSVFAKLLCFANEKRPFTIHHHTDIPSASILLQAS